MAPAIKIVDLKPNDGHRHNKVFQTFGKIGVNVKKVHDGKGVFFAVANEEYLEKILADTSKETFKNEGFEIVPPIEYNSMKTVVIKHIDPMIDSYSDDYIVTSIHKLNAWATVESIYQIPSAIKILKIRFKNQQMVQTALDKGIIILHQSIPSWNIEKELFIRLNPCRNCYDYDHRQKECTKEKNVRCTFCAGEHKQSECTATQP